MSKGRKIPVVFILFVSVVLVQVRSGEIDESESHKIIHGRKDFVEKALKIADPNQGINENELKNTPLDQDNKEYVHRKEGESSMHFAAYFGQDDVVESYVKNGINVDIEDDVGGTPLHYAAWNGHEQVLVVLINNGAKVDHEDERGMTALQLAANSGHLNAVKFLITCGADVNHKDNNGFSVLDWTPQEEYRDVANVLIENGAKLNRMTSLIR